MCIDHKFLRGQPSFVADDWPKNVLKMVKLEAEVERDGRVAEE